MADEAGKPAKLRKYTPRSYDKLVGVDPQSILDRVAQGELLRDIAEDYGCTRPAVSMFIARSVDAEAWAMTREQSIASRIENSAKEIEQAEDQLTLARAREAARLWMWRAEREHPNLYAARPQTAVQINGQDGMSVQVVSYIAPDQAPKPAQLVDNTINGEDASTD